MFFTQLWMKTWVWTKPTWILYKSCCVSALQVVAAVKIGGFFQQSEPWSRSSPLEVWVRWPYIYNRSSWASNHLLGRRLDIPWDSHYVCSLELPLWAPKVFEGPCGQHYESHAFYHWSKWFHETEWCSRCPKSFLRRVLCNSARLFVGINGEVASKQPWRDDNHGYAWFNKSCAWQRTTGWDDVQQDHTIDVQNQTRRAG